MACVYTAQETGKAGRVICVIATANEPFDDPASFTWTIDGKLAGSRRKLNIEGVSQGGHTVSVTGDLHGQQSSFSTLINLSEGGSSTSTFVLNASCSYDVSSGIATCHATPANPPAKADLVYTWLWNGAGNDSKTDTLTVKVPNIYQTYPAQVIAFDRVSSTNSAVASTSLTVGTPSSVQVAGQAINGITTGTFSPPNTKDPGAVAGGAAAVGIGLGLVAAVSAWVKFVGQTAELGGKIVKGMATDAVVNAAAAGDPTAQAVVKYVAGSQLQQVASDWDVALPASFGEPPAPPGSKGKPLAHPRESRTTPANLGAGVILGVGNNITSASDDYRDRYIKLRDEIKDLEAKWKVINDRARAAYVVKNDLQDKVEKMLEEQSNCKTRGEAYAREDELKRAESQLNDAKSLEWSTKNDADYMHRDLEDAWQRMRTLRQDGGNQP